MSKFPRDPSVLDWSRKIHKCQKPERVVKVIAKMRPLGSQLHPNCSHTAYMTCLCIAAAKYAELLAAIEEAQSQTI